MTEEWRWKWVGEGRDDVKINRGRVYYDSISAYRKSDRTKRVYNVGDVVVMAGEDQESWLAQIVEMFNVEEDDAELQEILRLDLSRNADALHHYECMRVTLRWFYTRRDVSRDTLRRAKMPKPIPYEYYFSDHVEKDGYNDVTVIEGLAFMLDSAMEREAFLRDPDKRYDKALDTVGIVRCFVNSTVEDYELRQLEKGELEFLLKNPCKDKNLYENGRQKLLGKGKTNGPILKGLHKKRKRSGRASVDIEDEEYEPEPKKTKTPTKGRAGNDSAKKRSSQERRRKHVVSDDDDDEPIAQSIDDTDDDAPIMNLSAKQAQDLNRATDEVLDLVSELNASASLPETETGKRGNDSWNEVYAIDPTAGTAPKKSSSQPRKKPSPSPPIGTIVIVDDDESDENEPIQAKRERLKPIVSKRERAPPANQRRPEKSRPSFMPTARDRKTTAEQRGSPQMSSPPMTTKPKPLSIDGPPAKKDSSKLNSMGLDRRVLATIKPEQKRDQKVDMSKREKPNKQVEPERRPERKLATKDEMLLLQDQAKRPDAHQKKDTPLLKEDSKEISRKRLKGEPRISLQQASTSQPSGVAASSSERGRNSSEAMEVDRKQIGLGSGVRSRTSIAKAAHARANEEAEAAAKRQKSKESNAKRVSNDTSMTPVTNEFVPTLDLPSTTENILVEQDTHVMNSEDEGDSPMDLDDKDKSDPVDIRMSSNEGQPPPSEGNTISREERSTLLSQYRQEMEQVLRPITDQLRAEYPTYDQSVQEFIRNNVDFMFERVRTKSNERGLRKTALVGEQQRAVWKEISSELQRKLMKEGSMHLAKAFEHEGGERAMEILG